MDFQFNSLTLTGLRGDNQDCILEPITSGLDLWCAIADGVSGANHGAVASKMCIDALKHNVEDGRSMQELFNLVYEFLNRKAQKLALDRSMGSTLSVLRLSHSRAFVGHVGDTRITHYRGNSVMSRTHDQTEVQKLLDYGVISKYQAQRYPRRNVILSAMSPDQKYSLFENEFSLKHGDRILLTIDGFHKKFEKKLIAQVSESCSTFDLFFRSIRRETLNVTFDDDATCLAIEVQNLDQIAA